MAFVKSGRGRLCDSSRSTDVMTLNRFLKPRWYIGSEERQDLPEKTDAACEVQVQTLVRVFRPALCENFRDSTTSPTMKRLIQVVD